MREVPFSGRLDVGLACLLVVERHGSVANRCVTRDELTTDLIALAGELDVPPECLGDLDAFDVEVERALIRLLSVGWIEDRTSRGVAQFAARGVADEALSWIRSRLLHDSRKAAAYERLDEAVTARVLSDYGHTVRASGANQHA